MHTVRQASNHRDLRSSPLMAGFWRLLYSDFDPPAPSSGKLGPFVGSVYQDLDPKAGVGRNMIRCRAVCVWKLLVKKAECAASRSPR
jgi:hypothetical protein